MLGRSWAKRAASKESLTRESSKSCLRKGERVSTTTTTKRAPELAPHRGSPSRSRDTQAHTAAGEGRKGVERVEAKHIPADNRRNTAKQIKRYFCHVAVAVASRSSQRHRGTQALFVSLAPIASPDSRCPMPAMPDADACHVEGYCNSFKRTTQSRVRRSATGTLLAFALHCCQPPFANASLSLPRCHPLLFTQSR